jgi:hypothetical protein
MDRRIAVLLEKIGALEAELEAVLAQRRAELRVGLEKGRAFFEEEILRRHRELKVGQIGRLVTVVRGSRSVSRHPPDVIGGC